MKRTAEQLRASDPKSHVWVAASAGTGKTHVLIDRMLRLMLAGASPDRILALTFTKAAANEMQNRLTQRLGQWQGMPADELSRQLELLGAGAEPTTIARARSLFPIVLDLPGGLQLVTIHAFAQGLLASFPVEADLPPGFKTLSERDQRLLERQALNDVIVDAQLTGDRTFLDQLAQLSIQKGESGIRKAVAVMIGNARGLMGFTSGDGLELAVRRFLGVEADATVEGILLDSIRSGLLPHGSIRAFSQGMTDWATKTGLDVAQSLNGWLASSEAEQAAGFEALKKACLTQANEPRKHAILKKRDDLQDLSYEICTAILRVEERRNSVSAAIRASGMLRAGHRVVHRYQALKKAQLAIDYDDMILKTVQLLGPSGMPGYVNWKLDRRFDHALVDEAQDTNEAQWEIIGRLVEDYFEQEASRTRTMFVVGDYKQAIYGFQGTDPRVFEKQAKRIEPLTKAQGRPLDKVDLDLSFRSGPAILQFVDAFIADATPEALGLTDDVPSHRPSRATDPGEVVLWPLLVPPEVDEEAEDSEEPEENDDADRRMAIWLADRISEWLTPGPKRLWLPAKGRYAKPDDILILLRQRSSLMGLLVGRLHENNVPVAGVDRLLLTEPLAVLDLLALIHFAVQPEDDLTLATLLVSPFIGWDHEDIRLLGGGKPGLWEALGKAALTDMKAAEARRFLSAVLSQADRAGPYEFLDTILSGQLDGRRKLLARLGPQANDPIDELLGQALLFEGDHPPALAGFLSWIEADGAIVKRDSESSSGMLRLMTIHGSKGLEAPVVVLADAGRQPQGDKSGFINVVLDGGHEVPLPYSSKEMPAPIAYAVELNAAEKEAEDLRLLYVALTRPADHLFIGGAVGPAAARRLGTDKDKSWHGRLSRVMSGLEPDRIELPGGEGLRLRAGLWTDAADPMDGQISPAAAAHAVVTLNLDPAPALGNPWRPLIPSALPEAPGDGPTAAAAREAALRGTLIHRLFERLPAVPEANREATARRWLEMQGADNHADSILAHVLSLLADPRHSALFGPNALAEAPIAGLVGTRAIAGTVDRLLIEDHRVLVVDFKTGIFVPANLELTPLSHRKQMAAYVAVLSQVFPDRPVEAGLLYTAGPKLIFMGAKELDGLLPLE